MESKFDTNELERFKSSFHANTGERIDDDMALLYFEVTKDRKAVINIVSNASEKVNKDVTEFIVFEKKSTESLTNNILILQKGVERLTLRTEEKRASLLSILLNFFHNRSVIMRYFLGILLLTMFLIPSYYSYMIYTDFKSLKSTVEAIQFTTVNVKGVNYKAATLPSGAFVKKGILYLPVK